jgi:NAD(P)-dependent dehydrogenase (short-subunit alcohol dehydrogenase family)
MSRRFTGKVAVVTGGNSGIGLATAKAYAREGARVAITGRSEESLATAAKEIGSETLAIRADVTRLPEIDRAVERIKERFGRIDALFVNAGIGKFVPFEEVTEAFYDETMNANLKGAFFTVQRAAPLFTEGAGVVLNASINAHMGMPGSTVYGATKAAVVNLAKTMKEWITGQVPLKRFGHPDEIASAVLYLTSDESRFVVGTELVVDGGMIGL